jgi:outer membrane protein OmpA-like peptidoglycan-associated protein
MYCRFILSACCLFIGLSAFTQSTNIKKGDLFMQKGEYGHAAAYYKKAADNNLSDITAKEKLAKALMALGDYSSAEAVYQILAGSPKAGAIDKFYYAQVLRMNGKYEVADIQYRAYAEEHPNDPLNDEFRNFATNVQSLVIPNPHYQVTNIPENSAENDEGPTLCLYTFCFTSNRPSLGKKGTYDLYFLRGGNASNPAKPQKIKGDINSHLDEGPATFNSNGHEMIFTRSNYKHKSDDGVMKLGLYHADYDTVAQKWFNITTLPFVNYNNNYMQPSLSKDGSRLFFASDMPGGLGETDIYVSEKQGNTWGPPVNLGSSINTSGTEGYPFIADDGTLYFASDSRMGLGGLDIYAATPTASAWGRVLNAGAPLNSSRNDFGYIADANGRSGYFVSNRPGGMGGNDIYHFTLNTNSVCDTLLDADTQLPVPDAAVTITAGDSTHKNTTSNANGELCFELESGMMVTVAVNKPGYSSYTGQLSASPDMSQVIYLKHQGTIELDINISEPGNDQLQSLSAIVVDAATQQTVAQGTIVDGVAKFNLEPNRDYVLKVNGEGTQGAYQSFVRPISTIGLKSGQVLKEDAPMIYSQKVTANNAAVGKSAENKVPASKAAEPVAGNRNAGNTTTASKNIPAHKSTAGNHATENPVTTGTDGPLPNVYFGVGSYSLDAGAQKVLDRIAARMQASSGMQVEISSNTDATGSVRTNMVLSARRALACLNYLTGKGISESRFIAVGYGDKKLLNNCSKTNPCTQAEQAQNRRTEFKIIKP